MAACRNIEQEIEALNRVLQDRAALGRWADFGALMRQRDRLIESVPEAARRQVLEMTLAANAAILRHARADRDRTQERLADTRQKSSVSRYYRCNGGMPAAR